MLEIAIVGGGLCGLAVANSLKSQGLSFAVFEARPRLGGRIHSVKAETNGLALDLGAAWFWPDNQPRITRLLNELKLPSFPQHDTGSVLNQTDPDAKPETMAVEDMHGGAQRIEGGAISLINALAARLPADSLRLEHVLTGLTERSDHIELHFQVADSTITLQARQVVLAMPPRLVEERLQFDPPLNGQVRESLRETPTWMAHQAKLVMAYGGADGIDAIGMGRAAFWRDAGLSGNVIVNHSRATLGEVHDACDAIGARAALSSFFALSPSARASFRVGLTLLARSQLDQLFGPQAHEGEAHVMDWSEEKWTCATLDMEASEDHPLYNSLILQTPVWRGRLHFGGSETAAYGGGYMEGALEAAGRIRREILVSRASDMAQTATC